MFVDFTKTYFIENYEHFKKIIHIKKDLHYFLY